jgi:hypothetical protein
MAIPDRLLTLRHLLPRPKAPVEDERLLKLYWNRAELKKAFSHLQDERYALNEELKRQEAAAMRAREQFDELELYLGEPSAGFTSIAYYQLRALWRGCAQRLQRFAEELGRQQEDRERRRSLIEFDQDRRRRLAAIDRELIDAQSEADTLEAQLKLTQNRHAAMGGFWNYFKRHKLAETMVGQRDKWARAQAEVGTLEESKAEALAAPAPPYPDISVEGRRIVNVATIAFAQYLLARLSRGGLALLARETTLKRVFDVHYGDADDCRRILAAVKDALELIAAERDNLTEIKDRTDRLRSAAAYRSDADTVPMPDSIGTLPSPAAPVTGLDATGRAAGINVLIDDYWDIYRALIP